MKKQYFYVTTTLPYVNAKPHIGHAVEFVRADVFARFKRSIGYDVFFNTGTDEHGLKIYNAAKQMGVSPQEYVNLNSSAFMLLLKQLNISYDNFIRTTDEEHMRIAQRVWETVKNNGYIYKKKYVTKYCVGCELEKTDSELINGKCADHPNMTIQEIEEENYFFKFSLFQDKLLDLYKSNPNFVVPDSRMNEIIKFVSGGLRDFSISRLKSKFSWGIPVPGDDEHIMYVWFDALINYISALGWPDSENFEHYWVHGTPTQYCGQDNLRQQSAMWQAILMAAEIPITHQIVVNGFVTGEGGVKMSKSLGNVIDPIALIDWYGTDALRYYLIRHIHPFNGSPITYDLFHNAYIDHLVNGLGNLTSRILALSERYVDNLNINPSSQYSGLIHKYVEQFRFDLACDFIWDNISKLDKEISIHKPFEQIKSNPQEAKNKIIEFVEELYTIANDLEIFMPETAKKIKESILHNRKPEPIFKRVEKINL